MSAYRDSLTPDQQPVYDEARSSLLRTWGRASVRRDSLSPEDAALEAYTPGGPSVEDIAELIRRHRAEARAKQAAEVAA